MSKRWIRLDVSWDHTDWVVVLEPAAQLAWIKLLCWVKVHGKKGRTKALSPLVAAKKWDLPVKAVRAMLDAATKSEGEQDAALKVEGGSEWVVVKWVEYQEPDSTAAERKRRQRDRERRPEKKGHGGSRTSRRDTRDRGRDPSRDHRPPTGDRTPTPASANADEGGPSFGEVMAVVRTELHLGKSTPETERSGHVLRRDFWGKVPVEDVVDACRGTRKLIEAGLVDRTPPGSPVGLRFLRTWKHDSRFLWDAALDHERHGAKANGPARASPTKVNVKIEKSA